ncbi:hypothetical protein TCAL_01860 [Tigriopus californicus]|uniref:Uncharacterized protein n=1 Tax=Tigriopus californicus TaxID=6832 RepID=A0A553NDL4_TIGCA|nr:leucine-rich repeat protein soc-2 homolog [Tigriopus californicus]TRY63508.1 hypothetical protein TCAL_01860 [Tigriopus californicus]|eukprot:TCALIF_01860-PA protein Name:"Similar to Lrrd1 Leucine-rich repeat and death domain-containing protein 1 (Mus musculus)" AED:0.40 eAED:0.40 QI:0/-1/0/1/-1/1/1/0/386
MPSSVAFEANLSFPTSNQVIKETLTKCPEPIPNYGDPNSDLSQTFIGGIMERILQPTQDKNATHLNLSHLNLKIFPIVVQKLKLLQYLDLSHNQFDATEFKGINSCWIGVKSLHHLRTVVLENCHLIELPAAFLQCKNLRVLRLHGNRIDRLNHSFTDLRWLEELDLSSNRLTGVPEAVKNLVNMTHLNLSGNKLEFFPEEILHISTLESMNLNQNRILFLPNDLDKLINLKTLRVAHNKLDGLPRSIPNQLTCLDVFDNGLFLDSVSKFLEGLEEFDADFNYFQISWKHYPNQKNKLRSGLKELEAMHRFKFPSTKKYMGEKYDSIVGEVQDSPCSSDHWDTSIETTSQSLPPCMPILHHAPFIQRYYKREYDPEGSEACFEDAD